MQSDLNRFHEDDKPEVLPQTPSMTPPPNARVKSTFVRVPQSPAVTHQQSSPHTRRLGRPATSSGMADVNSKVHLLPSSHPTAVITPGTPLASTTSINSAVTPNIMLASPSQLPQTLAKVPDGVEPYDWASFLTAYASGLWDPGRIPDPPRSTTTIPGNTSLSESSYRTLLSMSLRRATTEQSSLAPLLSSSQPSSSNPATPNPSEVGSSNALSSSSSFRDPVAKPLTHSIAQRRGAFELGGNMVIPPVPQRFGHGRTPVPNVLSTTAGITMSVSSPLPAPSNLESTSTDLTTAATVRWAGSKVDIGPLVLPSPEYELVDPLRGLNAAIPGSYNDVDPRSPPPLIDGLVLPKKNRLGSFWRDVNISNMRSNLTTISASPSPSPPGREHLSQTLPASAPAIPSMFDSAEDYFGSAALSDTRRQSNSSPDVSLSCGMLRTLTETAVASPEYSSSVEPKDPPLEPSMGTQPLGIRRLPAELAHYTFGYLPAPLPPNESMRRRALHQFNVLHTSKDANFDRIVHLAKLVFNTKIVVITLISADEQFFKAEAGFNSSGTSRDISFCAHTILQLNDEPMVILNAVEDWRFAKNPLVLGSPHIRFYAGASLRTQDGYNIGTLCLIDDQPRTEFGPRQRHSLKEFAAIVMREMELWRDKIQLRIRDRIQTSMENFTRECLEIDTQTEVVDPSSFLSSGSMERVYDRAAKLVKRTLDVTGAVVMDVSHFNVLETPHSEAATSVTLYHADPSDDPNSIGTSRNHPLSTPEYKKITEFFTNHPEGQIFSDRVPIPFRRMIPDNIQYAMIVPIFHVDKHPFALLCAYTLASSSSQHFLEGFELVYLRAIGVIILSAVLKRKMHLADKAKSLFISNISHELRTPLHGILAAAELLADTNLDSTQASFLQTVQACGTSLVETVNHVLDFTKLSGNTRGGGVDSVILPAKVDLVQLVEEAVEGCWVGAKARLAAFGQSGIGHLYSPPSGSSRISTGPKPEPSHVEAVVDIGARDKGWVLSCEKGGMRRVLMNLIGNSIKFTSDGYIHITLRELPPNADTLPGTVKVEMGVRDTGKGISKDFLKVIVTSTDKSRMTTTPSLEPTFPPLFARKPSSAGDWFGSALSLLPSTTVDSLSVYAGLSIVNSIIRSDSVNGVVEVWSTEGMGTEIKVMFNAAYDEGSTYPDMSLPLVQSIPTSVSLVGFTPEVRGYNLLSEVLVRYLHSWWGFDIWRDDNNIGDILLLNEDTTMMEALTEKKDCQRPIVVLSSGRGDARLMAAVANYEVLGGFVRIVFKPGGPSRLRQIFQLCLRVVHIRKHGRTGSVSSTFSQSIEDTVHSPQDSIRLPPLPLSNPDSPITPIKSVTRPVIPSSNPTYHISSPSVPLLGNPLIHLRRKSVDIIDQEAMIAIGDGHLRKSAAGTLESQARQLRTLIIEDNEILRSILVKWLTNRKCEYQEAVDGIHGVEVFESHPPGYFDVVLLDLSMPRLDGIGATTQIRKIEANRRLHASTVSHQQTTSESDTSFPPMLQGRDHTTRIVALTGMSSVDQKRKAFDAGVDGYLVKPVSFKTLDTMFNTLRVE